MLDVTNIYRSFGEVPPKLCLIKETYFRLTNDNFLPALKEGMIVFSTMINLGHSIGYHISDDARRIPEREFIRRWV